MQNNPYSLYDKVDPEEIIRLLQEIINKLNSGRKVQNGQNISVTLANRE